MKIGQIFHHHSNGQNYVCVGYDGRDTILRSLYKTNSGEQWQFTAVDVKIYDDGTIDWLWSAKGRFVREGA